MIHCTCVTSRACVLRSSPPHQPLPQWSLVLLRRLFIHCNSYMYVREQNSARGRMTVPFVIGVQTDSYVLNARPKPSHCRDDPEETSSYRTGSPNRIETSGATMEGDETSPPCIIASASENKLFRECLLLACQLSLLPPLCSRDSDVVAGGPRSTAWPHLIRSLSNRPHPLSNPDLLHPSPSRLAPQPTHRSTAVR